MKLMTSAYLEVEVKFELSATVSRLCPAAACGFCSALETSGRSARRKAKIKAIKPICKIEYLLCCSMLFPLKGTVPFFIIDEKALYSIVRHEAKREKRVKKGLIFFYRTKLIKRKGNYPGSGPLDFEFLTAVLGRDILVL
jgi:hypothetical protein